MDGAFDRQGILPSARGRAGGRPDPGREGRWGIILAGGDGTRLRPLTRRIAGDDRPKQFCSIVGGETLLDQTGRRAALAIAPERTLAVFTQSHERFYRPLLAALPASRAIVQPENRGTAPAIFYALLRLAAVAPDAPVAIFPSDHYVSDGAVFMAHVAAAFDAVAGRRTPSRRRNPGPSHGSAASGRSRSRISLEASGPGAACGTAS